mgnify:CR=1 FL=1
MLLVNIIHVNTIAMNKIKNIYRTLILLLSLVLMPVEGWGETAVLTKDNGYYKLDLKNAYLDANNNSYKYTYFFIEFIDKSEKIIDIASWSIKKQQWFPNIGNSTTTDWFYYIQGNRVFFDGSKGAANTWGMSTLYFTPPTDVNLEGAKIVLHLSNDKGLLTDATKEQATYTYNIRLAENLTDYSVKEASEPTNVISKKYVVDQKNAQASVTLDMNDVKYMRWQVLDKDGSVISSVSSFLTGVTATYQVVKDKYVWAKFDSWEPNNIAQESDRTVTFNLPSGKTWDDGYQVVCYWATDKSDGDFYSDGSKAYFFQEPTLSGKCVFSFMSTSAAESATFIPNTSSNIQKNTEIKATTEYSFSVTMPNTAKYMRWYVADKDGKVVNINGWSASGSSSSYKQKDNYYIWYNNDNETTTSDERKMTFTRPSDISWTDGYQVVCAWASSSDGSDILYDNNNNYYLLKEPNLSGLYVTTFTTAEQIKSKDLTLSSLSKTAVDESDVYMVNDGIEQVTVTIPKHSVKYVRWQLIDMTTGKTVDAVGEDGNLILNNSNNSNFTNRKKGSFVYYNATSSSDQSVRQVTFDKSQVTGAGEWSNYQLKAVWTDNVDGIDAPTLDSKPFIVAEPSVLQGAYTVNFKTVAQAPADLKLSSALSSNVINESDNFAVSGSKVTVTVPTHYLRYIRWQVIDKTTGKVIEALPDGTLSSSSTYNRGKGNYIGYSETSVSDENLRTITFDKSKLSTPGDWKNYQLKAVWTNDVTGMTSYIKTDGTRYVVSEPSVMQGVYTVSFADKSAVGTLVTSPDPTTTVKEVDGVLINNAKKQINVNLNHKLDEILSVLGKSSVSELGNLYIRWTVTDDAGNSFKTNGLGISSKKYNDFSNKYFNVLTKDPSSELSDLLKVSFAPTTELDKFDIKKVTNISCVITDDIEGLTETEGIVTKEPTSLKLKYQVNIVDPTKVPFRHYKGYANADGDYEVINKSKNQLRQKVSTWEYTYVVDNADHKTVSLMLPIQKFESSGDALEPLGYFRWYNYDTDNASANLSVEGSSSLLNSVKDADNVDKGLMAFNLMQHAIQSTVGVKYTRPSDPNWKGETIACDVSRYIDGIDATGTYMEHEPTLSIRYIFHIIPSTQMAEILKENLVNDSKDLTFEDNKNVTVGFMNDNSKMTLRLDFVDPKMYYFYPVTNTNKHVYYPAGSTEADTNTIIAQRKITKADFSSGIKKAATIEWRAYNGTRDKMCILGAGNVPDFPRFFDLSISLLNGATWTDLDGGTTTKPTFNPGDHFYVVAYVKDETGNFSSPMANFSIRYFRFYPKTFEEMGADDVTRQISYLDENYNNMAVVSFDNDSPEQTLSAPTSPDDNQSKNPSSWNKRSYGFVYKDLIDKSANKNGDSNVYYNTKHSPQHGEYGIYKTANVNGISGDGSFASGTDGYMWYSGKELHDRTYALTGKSQSGSFLYVDASDESRTIASAEFTASLCTGQQMAFSACIADMTTQTVKPQIMFRLFGLEKDEFGNIKNKKLLHSFSSGAFGTNRLSSEEAKWYQVYGKITIQQDEQVEKYSDFRIEIDNYSKGTIGADYAVDDIRIYLKPAKVEIYQDRPACGETSTGSIKLKIRAIHETLNAILNHKDTKIHYRLVNEDGSPVTGEGLYNYWLKGPDDATAKEIKTTKSYASVDVFDSEENCAKYEIDGVNMIEKDADGETYIILANHPFKLTKGKKYYVSVCADSNPDAPDANWGKPSDVCSIYSAIFEMIGQTPMITDTDGKVITEYRVNCTDSDPKVTLKGSLTTIDPNTGEKITLTGVPFLWYIDDSSTPVYATPSTTIEIPVSKIGYGAHKIYMNPKTAETNADGEMVFTVGSVKYLMCTEKIAVPLRIAKDGPQLNFGFNDVDYPFKDNSYEASLRIGLPQIKKLLEKTSQGYLQVPLHSASYKTGVEDKTLTFIDDSKTGAGKTSADVYVATTNDPLWDASLLNKSVATLSSSTLSEIVPGVQSTLDLKFSDAAVENFHEGYYYELRFAFEQKAVATGGTSCPGESYLKVKIVPEFITWTPTADGGMNANWNNDDNWHRSSSTELYDNEYTDYQTYGSTTSAAASSSKIEIPTLNSYVPMKFTKVTIANLNGLPFPDLGNIVYRSTNKIATKLTNGKGNEATKYIQYDIMAFWNEADTEKGLDTEGNLKCEKFYGNTCHQIYFKPQGELRDQCYLIYDKAWVEKELVPNKWYTMASPLQYIYAGDMYVPAEDGRQETKAFTDINFDDKAADGTTAAYSRSKYPVYQRAWMKSDVKEITPKSDYPAFHYPSVVAPENVDMNLGYWSHVYNKVDESYAADGTFGGFSIKAGNALLPKDQTKKALLRLPKADTSYQYYDYDGSTTSGGKSANVEKGNGHGKLLVAFNNDEKHLAEKTQTLGDGNNSGFYLVANPYTCSISLKKFFEVNTGLQNAIWIVENGEVKAISSTELDKQNYAIQPTQSFFVKKNDGATVTDVRFTSTMCIDRTITPGLLMASDYVKTVEVETENSNGQTSKARIALRQEASADYDDEEDVDLLYDLNLKDIPQVYTVAGSQAVAVNATPKIEWMPMGVIMENGEKNERVNLDFKGVAKLDAPLYLYDAANGQYTELQDGNEVSIQANEHGRYFLTQTRGTTGIQQIEAEAESNQLKVYSPAAGMIVVSALNGEKLGRVEVFTLDGKMVHSYQLPDKQRMILRVPSGVYIVKASTQSCAQAKGQKVAVR